MPKLTLVTPPAIEPVTLAQLREHLGLNSLTLADSLTPTQSIAPGAHVIAAAYSLVGTAVDVLDYRTLVLLESGTNGAGGTVDVKLQESDDNITYTDVTGGAFTQVTEANDNATYEKEYIGLKRYLRAVATVAVATCEFGVMVIKEAPQTAQDDMLANLITTARETCEQSTGRALITQTWNLSLDSWPAEIQIPLGKLQSIITADFKYKNQAGTSTAVPATVYDVDIVSDPGRVYRKPDQQWPTESLWPSNAITVPFVCGYGVTAATVPWPLKHGILMLAAHLYENREPVVTMRGANVIKLPLGVEWLWHPFRLWTKDSF